MGKSRTVSVSVLVKPVTLSINLSRITGPPGTVSVTGYLKEEATGLPIYGRSIVLWVAGLRYNEATTFSDGSYGFFGIVVEEGRYTFQSIFKGDDTYDDKATPLVIGNYGKVQSSVSINVTPSSGDPPLTVTIKGKLTRDDTGAALGGRSPIKLYQDGEVIDSMSTSLDPATLGQYEFTKTLERGTFSFFVEFPGDDEFLGCIGKDGTASVDGVPLVTGLGPLLLLALVVMAQE